MNAIQACVVLTAAGVAAWAAVAALIPVLRGRGMLDVPNRRSSHEVPVPRGGGLGLLAGVGVGLGAAAAFGAPVPGWPVVAGLAAVAVLGFLEDSVGGLAVPLRLVIQGAAAAGVMWQAGPLLRLPLPSPLDLQTGVFAWPLSLLWVVAVVNIFNFLDGIDGFGAFQGAVAGLGLAAVGWGSWVGPAGLAIAGASLGFGVHNWHPAKVFMGDSGSLAVGFLLAVMPFGQGQGSAPAMVFVAALCLWFFLSDGTFTIARRFVRGEKVWHAHRSHLYQRLVVAGWSHARVVRWVGIGMVIVAAAAVGAAQCGRPAALWAALCGAVILFVVYWAGVVAVERRAAGEEQRG